MSERENQLPQFPSKQEVSYMKLAERLRKCFNDWVEREAARAHYEMYKPETKTPAFLGFREPFDLAIGITKLGLKGVKRLNQWLR